MAQLVCGYDLDGVLAQGPPKSAKPWGRMTGPEREGRRQELLRFYGTAPTTGLRPLERRFDVITARKEDPEVRRVTTAWLEQYFPKRVRTLVMLPVARSVKNVVAFKAENIIAMELTDFTEDNPQIVRGLVLAAPSCRIWHLWQGRYYLADKDHP